MVKNIGEGHLLPEMKDCITKVQNLVTETNGAAWATAFAEVSFILPLSLPVSICGGSLTSSEEPRSAPKHPKMGH